MEPETQTIDLPSPPDLSEQVTEAEYQLSLLHLLREQASRRAQLVRYVAVSALGISIVGAVAAVFLIPTDVFQSEHFRQDGSASLLIALPAAIFSIAAALWSFQAEWRSKAEFIKLQEERLLVALDRAHARVHSLTSDVGSEG